MPYITKQQQKELIYGNSPVTAGELNYVITKEILLYLGTRPKYENYNEVMGVLECVKQELYRRAVAPHEDKKRKENGDVYE